MFAELPTGYHIRGQSKDFLLAEPLFMQFRLRCRRLRFIAENCQQVKVGKLLLLSLHEKKLLKVTESYFSIYYIKVHSNATCESHKIWMEQGRLPLSDHLQ